MTKYLGCSMSMPLPSSVIIVLVAVFILFPFFETQAMAVAAGEVDHNLVDEEMMSSSGHVEEDLMNWAGYGEEKLSVVTVTGRVVCRDPCHSIRSDGIAQLHSFPVSGATVSISSGTKGSKKYKIQATTDENGDFFVELPSHLHAIPNLHKFSYVKVMHLPKKYSNCRPRKNSIVKQMIRGLKLMSTENGVRAYVAETMHLTPRSSKGCKFNRRTSN